MAVKKITKPQASLQRAKPKRRSASSKINSEPFPIVAIGASAGGLKAFEGFFANMPADSGAGFVLIPHLGPNHVSMLPELLKNYTEMAIVQAEDGMKVEANRIHVIPPNNAMTIADGMLRLQRLKEPRGLRLPIDIFFTSLAADRGPRAVGIILSGNGMDGTLGLEAIKARSGMAMAQEPATAEYDGMPRSAVAVAIGGLCASTRENGAATHGLLARRGSPSRLHRRQRLPSRCRRSCNCCKRIPVMIFPCTKKILSAGASSGA